MTSKAVLVGIVGFFLGAAWPLSATADGALVGRAALSPSVKARLEHDVKAMRAAQPSAFARVADVRARLPELDRTRRGRFAPVAELLMQQGKPALVPMLSEIALDSRARGPLGERAWTAWRAGLLEAVGRLRAPEAEPVLVAVLDGPETDFDVMRAAAAALGRLGSDSAAAKLVALAGAEGPKQAGVLAGMGECRRAIVVNTLAQAVAARPDAATAKDIVRSLSTAGNSWAWKTPHVRRHAAEEDAVRAGAAAAIFDAFLAYDGEVRQAASNALLVVDYAGTTALIDATRADADADVELARALDALGARFARNPVRR